MESKQLSWIRKKPFYRQLWAFLKGFRIIQVITEISDENGVPPMLQRQAGAYRPTGRQIIRITLIGKLKRQTELDRLEGAKEGVRHEGA